MIIHRVRSFLLRLFYKVIDIIYYIFGKAIGRKIPNKVIVRVDGGIASQMHFYLIGRVYAEKGYNVEYDLSYYKSSVNSGVLARNFNLCEAFPELNFKEANPIDVALMKKSHTFISDVYDKSLKYMDLVPPLYAAGYYHDFPNLYRVMFKKYFKVYENVFPEEDVAIYKNILSAQNSVAVHVRRGDLSSNIGDFYGSPVSIDYFNKAIKFLEDKIGPCIFYFFSDEPKWVERELLPKLNMLGTSVLEKSYGSEKGYLDLFLISACKHQVSSKGSFGKYGALLNDYPNKMLIISNDDRSIEWDDYLDNVIYL